MTVTDGPSQRIEIRLASGRRAQFEVDSSRHADACFVLSVRKSGSTIANNMLTALALSNGWRFVDVDAVFFAANIKTAEHQRDPSMLEILRRGNVYGGFRAMPFGFLGSPVFEDGRKLLVIRDPRDALVSEFFSNAFSHPIPEPVDGHDAVTRLMLNQRENALGQGIDRSVMERAAMLGGSMLQYAFLLRDPHMLVIKYEDFIFRKREFLHRVAGHFGWNCNEEVLDAIMVWAEVRPDDEDPQSFVRQVSPGDHRRKLKPDTIRSITASLAPALEIFNYTA